MKTVHSVHFGFFVFIFMYINGDWLVNSEHFTVHCSLFTVHC